MAYLGFHKGGPNFRWPLVLTQRGAKPGFVFFSYGEKTIFFAKGGMAQYLPKNATVIISVASGNDGWLKTLINRSIPYLIVVPSQFCAKHFSLISKVSWKGTLKKYLILKILCVSYFVWFIFGSILHNTAPFFMLVDKDNAGEDWQFPVLHSDRDIVITLKLGNSQSPFAISAGSICYISWQICSGGR